MESYNILKRQKNNYGAEGATRTRTGLLPLDPDTSQPYFKENFEKTLVEDMRNAGIDERYSKAYKKDRAACHPR